MNEDIPRKLDDLINAVNGAKQSVVDAVYASNDPVADQLQHISGQLDIMNHSLYVTNEFMRWGVVSLMLLAALGMFTVGYYLTRR